MIWHSRSYWTQSSDFYFHVFVFKECFSLSQFLFFIFLIGLQLPQNSKKWMKLDRRYVVSLKVILLNHYFFGHCSFRILLALYKLVFQQSEPPQCLIYLYFILCRLAYLRIWLSAQCYSVFSKCYGRFCSVFNWLSFLLYFERCRCKKLSNNKMFDYLTRSTLVIFRGCSWHGIYIVYVSTSELMSG